MKHVSESTKPCEGTCSTYVILLGSHTTSFADLHGHGAADNVTRGKILGRWSVALHETFTLGVSQDTTFSTASLSHQAASTVDSSRVELHELIVLVRKTLTQSHGVAVSCACVRTRAREIGTSVSSSGEHSVLCEDTVDRSIFHVQGNHTDTLAIVVHKKIEAEVLNEVGGIKGERSTIESVQHGVPRTIRSRSTAVGLPSLSELKRLSSKGTLVDLTVFGTTERHTELLEF